MRELRLGCACSWCVEAAFIVIILLSIGDFIPRLSSVKAVDIYYSYGTEAFQFG